MAIADELAAIDADPSITDKAKAKWTLKATRLRDQAAVWLNQWLTIRATAPIREVYVTSVLVTNEGDLRVELMARQGGVDIFGGDGDPFFIGYWRNPPVLDETRTQNLVKVARTLITRIVPWPQ